MACLIGPQLMSMVVINQGCVRCMLQALEVLIGDVPTSDATMSNLFSLKTSVFIIYFSMVNAQATDLKVLSAKVTGIFQ